MRRTYRSKKDTEGALDHRDVLLNVDEKSSAFDAFYIQNIKQSKRELSCVRSSNAYGVPFKKVRKRKYVKRIVKEVENVQPRESMSTSTYLTPDKSIRVNKILDPFDQLLNSSSTGQCAEAESKNDIFGKVFSKKESKTYIRKKVPKAKKFNYSSDCSTDSDKENSKSQQNTTDIRTHELHIEPSNSPKYLDESINKIVNNLFLINNFKRKNSSFNTSYKNRNRFTNNSQSPILQKSPLCSTPFKDKYRGKSIYNFSPISRKEIESNNYVTIIEENNESNNSIVFLCKEKVKKLSKEHTQLVINPRRDDDVLKKDEISLIYEDEIVDELDKHEGNQSKSSTKDKCSESEQSLFQITEAEPFLGFSGEKVTESIIKDKNYLLKCIEKHNSDDDNEIQLVEKESKNDIAKEFEMECSFKNLLVDESVNDNKTVNDTDQEELMVHNKSLNKSEDINCSEKSLYALKQDDCIESENDSDASQDNSSCNDFDASKESDRISNSKSTEISKEDQDISLSKETDSSDSNTSIDSDIGSMYDTCESEQSFATEINSVKEPKVTIERLNDFVFIKYYEKMLRDQTQSSSSNSLRDESQSNNNISGTENVIQMEFVKEPKVTIERLNDLKFIKYYEKILRQKTKSSSSNSLKNESQHNNDTSGNDTDNDSQIEFDEENTTNNNIYASDSISNCSQEKISENMESEVVITDSSTTEDMESYESNNEDDRHVSFVTTRRRNEITNDSMFIFNNSHGSSSTDCDKTVLSNKARLSCFEKSDIDLDISVNNGRTSNNFARNEEDSNNKFNVNARKSSKVINNENDITNESCNNEATIIGDEEYNETIVDMSCSTRNTPELATVTTRKSSRALRHSIVDTSSRLDTDLKPGIVLQPGKKWERSLSIYRRMTTMADHFDQSLLEEDSLKGRKYRQSVINTMEMQDSLHNESINSRRSTFISKPSRPTIRFVKDSNNSRTSINTTEVFDDLQGFLTEECDDTVIELSKLSLDSELEVTVIDGVHESSGRVATAREYVLRRCNQTAPILFDECYPETVLKNCHKIGEGVYGEVFLWRGRDGRARVMKIVPIAGACKVNGEQQKDFHEVISEIVIAMELSALRAPIADIDRYFDEGKDVASLDLHAIENATDVFNEVLAVRCVQGPYPSRLLDLWELYDECKGSENDNPAALPAHQQYMVLELANAGQDLESYQFTGAQQAYALFQQLAFGLAVGEEAFQFEHRDLHWGNVLIAPTEQKFATFVLRGRTYRIPRGGVSATIIDYSLSRVTLPLAGAPAALYNDLADDEQLFDAVGDYQFQVYRLMRDKLGNEWKNFEPYTNILWLHYTVDKMITALRYKRTTTKIHKHYIDKLKAIKDRILDYKSATEFVLTDFE